MQLFLGSNNVVNMWLTDLVNLGVFWLCDIHFTRSPGCNCNCHMTGRAVGSRRSTELLKAPENSRKTVPNLATEWVATICKPMEYITVNMFKYSTLIQSYSELCAAMFVQFKIGDVGYSSQCLQVKSLVCRFGVTFTGNSSQAAIINLRTYSKHWKAQKLPRFSCKMILFGGFTSSPAMFFSSSMAVVWYRRTQLFTEPPWRGHSDGITCSGPGS